MIGRIIAWCISHRLLVVLASLAMAGWGAWAAPRTPLDAIPDLSDVQVIIQTDWPGRSPALIEDQVTYPIVTALLSTPRVRAVRGFTDFGISYVYVVFNDDVETYWARSRVVEALQAVRSSLPEGVEPAVGPDATGVGWVFQYAVVDQTGGRSLDELRSLQDWTIRYGLADIPGVAEVASIGGFVKQYQVNLNPSRLAAYNLSLRQVVDAIRASNNDSEGRLLEFSGREYMVRTRGYLRSISDIEQISLGTDAAGTPVLVGDVAEVRIGPDMRRGVAELDGKGEAVGGIVVMRSRENALRVIGEVKTRLSELQKTLPAGVSIVPVYDRSRLVEESIGTLRRILIEEAIVVSLVVAVFLWSWRSALVPLIALPVSLLVAFVPIWYSGISTNIMSLGGLALAIGVLVDAAIVMVENAYRQACEEQPVDGRLAAIARASRQVGRPVFFSLAAIVVSFAPVFLLEGQEGRLFFPLALTKTLAVGAATILAITLVPALLTLVLPSRGEHATGDAGPVSRACAAIYEPLLRLALRWKWAFLWVNAAVIPLTALLYFSLGHEFMPPLYEGSALYMPSAPTGLPVTEATRLLQQQDRIIRGFPEVERVFGSAGRATTATDNSPLSMFNTIVTFKPQREWRSGLSYEDLVSEMDRQLQFPGIPNVWTQPIINRLDMLSTGIKSSVGIKILGSDLNEIQRLGLEVEHVLNGLPETRSAYAERVADGYFVDVTIDRPAIARYGLTVEEVEDAVQIAVGGASAGQMFEGRERYPISVRYQTDFRDDVQKIEQLLVKTPGGAQVPLGALARVAPSTGPSMIRNEGGRLAGYVFVETSSRDTGGYVTKAAEALSERVKLPAGYRLSWSGRYESQLRAAARLRVIVPLALAVIFGLLWLVFRSVPEALTVMLSVAYAMTGGIVLQWALGYNFSVAVWVGYITLYGVAIQTGVIMVVYLQEALDRRLAAGAPMTDEALIEVTVAGAVLRLRPKLMTVAATIAGLLPILWSSGIGADILKPIAAPIVGGMITSAVHVLLITPILFYLSKRRASQSGS